MGLSDLERADATTISSASFDIGESVTYYPTGAPADPETIDVIVFRGEPERRDTSGRIHEALMQMPVAASSNAPDTKSEFDLVLREGDAAKRVRVSVVGSVTDGFYSLFVNR